MTTMIPLHELLLDFFLHMFFKTLQIKKRPYLNGSRSLDSIAVLRRRIEI
jgi:hypothetical protein